MGCLGAVLVLVGKQVIERRFGNILAPQCYDAVAVARGNHGAFSAGPQPKIAGKAAANG